MAFQTLVVGFPTRIEVHIYIYFAFNSVLLGFYFFIFSVNHIVYLWLGKCLSSWCFTGLLWLPCVLPWRCNIIFFTRYWFSVCAVLMGNLSQQGHGGSLYDEYCFSICVQHSSHDMLTLVSHSGLVSPNAGKGGLPCGLWFCTSCGTKRYCCYFSGYLWWLLCGLFSPGCLCAGCHIMEAFLS